MAELSYFHDGVARGDANEAPYGDEIFHTIMKGIHTGENSDGVVFDADYITALAATANAVDMDITIAAGSAYVQGVYFNNSAPVVFTLDTEPGSTRRFDRIIIRVNWAAQTATLAVIKGVSGTDPTIPSLQQDFGEIWEFPLYRVYLIGSSGLVLQTSVYDERLFVNNAQCPPIINIMHNSEFIAGANTAYDGEAPAYWWATGGYTINNGDSDQYQARGQYLNLIDTVDTDTLETDLFACDLSTTYYPNETLLTIAFYVQATEGAFGIHFNGGAGAYTYTIVPTDEPVLILYRVDVSSTFNTVGFYIRSYGDPATLELYQVTAAFGPNPAPFTQNKETILFGTKVIPTGTPFTRSTGAYTLAYSLLPFPEDNVEINSAYLFQRVYDSGSAGGDVRYAAIGNANNLRTEVGRLANNVRRQHVSNVPMPNVIVPPLATGTIPIEIVASGAGNLIQEIYTIGCEV